MNKLLLIIFSFSILASCASPQAEVKTEDKLSSISDLPEWARDAVIYEVNLRQFTPEGTFEAFQTHLPRLKEMGVDILWLMPIHPISKTKRKGTLGSYYAVSDYKDVNPEHGTMDDFKTLVDDIHDQGMHIIIDWVPNHTGWDNKWIVDHPEWYTKNASGEIIDPVDPGTGKSWGWTDVADLNYDNPEMRKAMIEALQFWIKDIGIDGYRMDVAHNVPNGFWDEVAPSLKKIKPVYLLAEAEMKHHRNSNDFHTSYGWSFHHLMNDIAKGKHDVTDILKWYETDRKKFSKGFHMHFTSNHDENTWSGTVFDRMGDAHEVMAVLTFTFDGMPLIYSGQEEPLRKRLEFFEKDDIGFANYEYEDFYASLCQLKSENPALWNGEYGGSFTHLFPHPDVFVFKRQKGDNSVVCVLNLSDKIQEITIPVTEEFGEAKIVKGVKLDKSNLTLEPWAYSIYTK